MESVTSVAPIRMIRVPSAVVNCSNAKSPDRVCPRMESTTSSPATRINGPASRDTVSPAEGVKVTAVPMVLIFRPKLPEKETSGRFTETDAFRTPAMPPLVNINAPLPSVTLTRSPESPRESATFCAEISMTLSSSPESATPSGSRVIRLNPKSPTRD